MDHSELGEPNPMDGFRFKFIEPQDYDATMRVLRKNLYRAAVPIGYDDRYPEDYDEFFMRIMKRGTNMSYIAVDIKTGEIAACRMVDLVEKDVESDLNALYPPYMKHKSTIDTFKLGEDMCKDVNLFEKYNIDKYADMYGLCVEEKYRQRGLATEMYRRGLNYLQKRGFKIVKCGFINPFTRRAGYKHGFQEISRRYFHDCKDEQGNILNPNSDPTDFLDYGVFDLRNRQIE